MSTKLFGIDFASLSRVMMLPKDAKITSAAVNIAQSMLILKVESKELPVGEYIKATYRFDKDGVVSGVTWKKSEVEDPCRQG